MAMTIPCVGAPPLMPRDLPLGNSSLQINFDSAYHLVDLYYPYVGQNNQAMGHPFRVGIWIVGEFAWVDARVPGAMPKMES